MKAKSSKKQGGQCLKLGTLISCFPVSIAQKFDILAQRRFGETASLTYRGLPTVIQTALSTQ